MAGSAAHVLKSNDITMMLMLVKNSDNDAEDSGGPCSKQKHDLQAVEKGFGVGRTERFRGQVPSMVDLLLVLLKNVILSACSGVDGFCLKPARTAALLI